MKASEYRNMTDEELAKKLEELKSQLFSLRFNHAIGQLNSPIQINLLKKDIARVKTIQNV